MIRFHRLAGVLILTIQVLAGETEKFIRVDEDDSAARLQTSITRYEKRGATVDLIGAIHIADKGYYAKLNDRFKNYDALLFEMVGGEKIAAAKRAAAEPVAAEPGTKESPPEKLAAGEPAAEKPGEGKPAADEPAPEKKERDLSVLRKVYDAVANALNLTGQVDVIDYHARNFVHADLTNKEFNRLQHERGESLFGFALKAAAHSSKTTKQPSSLKLLRAMLSHDANLLKLEIIHTLGQSEDQIAAFAGQSVIIDDRNRRCLEVMNRELAAGHKNLGIFYGAAHFPDMEKRLLEQGFKQVKKEWFTAWDIPKPKP
ncbi:MAG: hypothetical protein WCS43_14655 [Verrucomicrobiota bacterium]